MSIALISVFFNAVYVRVAAEPEKSSREGSAPIAAKVHSCTSIIYFYHRNGNIQRKEATMFKLFIY